MGQRAVVVSFLIATFFYYFHMKIKVS